MSLANGPTAALQYFVHSLTISYQLTPASCLPPMQLREIVTPSLGNHFPLFCLSLSNGHFITWEQSLSPRGPHGSFLAPSLYRPFRGFMIRCCGWNVYR